MLESDRGDLVIVVPGILGSRLVRVDGGRRRTVWDLSLSARPGCLRALTRGETNLHGVLDGGADDGVEADGPISTPQWLPGLAGVVGYDGLIERLRSRLGRDRVLGFGYDWRLSVEHNAAGLGRFVEGRLADWRVSSGASGAKVVLVGHSMGGLVAGHYCDSLGGSRFVRLVATVGTPHRGSMRALDTLVNGKVLGGLVDLTALATSLPSVYQLLPLFPCLESGDRLLRVTELDLPNVDPDRLAWSATTAARRAEATRATFESGASPPYERLVATGFGQSTALCGRVDGRQLTLFDHDLAWPGGARTEDRSRAGDGTVPWFAALPTDWDDDGGAVPLGGKHAALHNARSLVELLLGRIAPGDARGKRGGTAPDDAGGHAPERETIALDAPVVVLGRRVTGADVVVDTHCGSSRRLVVEMTHCRTGQVWCHRHRPGGGRSSFRQLPAGAYVVSARTDPPDPAIGVVDDYVLVMDEAAA